MMNQMLITLTAGIASVLPAQCTPAPQPERPPQVIYIPQDYSQRFNAEAGDTIVLIMNNDSDEVAELNYCEDRGGELQYNEFTDILTCYDIDF